MKLLKATLLSLACVASLASADDAGVLRPTELRADKLPQATVLRQLEAGATLKLLSMEGGWAWVEDRGVRGWVRASALKTAGDPTLQLPSSAREAATTSVSTLGVRGLPPRNGRHALIITIGRYGDKNISALPGAKLDRQSATQIAQAMQIPSSNIRYLADEEATGDGIRKALAELNERVLEGDRVYVHFSGHGTRFLDRKTNNGCTEALLAHEAGWSGALTSREMAELLAPVSRKADKMFVMYDACYSGGVLGSEMRTRGLLHPSDEGELRPRFSMTDDECSRPVNVRATRNLVVEAADTGVLPNDIIHLSSSKENEISFDDESKGGLATNFVRDCMLRDAVDLDGSGAISIDEIRACAQQKLNKRLENDSRFKPSTLLLTGNDAFVPTWFGATQLAAVTSGTAAASKPPAMVATPAPSPAPAPVAVVAPPAAPAPIPVVVQPAPIPVATAPVAPPPVVVAPQPITGAQALRQLYEQRDAKRRVSVKASADRLQIRKDVLEFSVQSDRPGFVYVAMAASDNKALQVLFPNGLDQDNAIAPGRPLTLPRANWRVRAGGPAGTNNLLVLVTDAKRDLAGLAAEGPFLKSLNNIEGRAELGALMTRARPEVAVDCRGANRTKNPSACSDAFGAAMFTVEEVQ